jgi:hypothetical protein
MTKRDFEAIAAIIARERSADYDVNTKDAALNRVTNDLAGYFKTVNPRFDAGRFFAATDGWS